MTYRDPEKAKLYRAEWGKRNPWVLKAINSNRRAKHHGAPGKLTSAGVRAIMEAHPFCTYCGTPGNPAGTRAERLTIDHIVPLSKGGENSHENLQVACGRCNARKFNGDRLGWSSRYDACIDCGTTARKYGANGLCTTCYARSRYVPVQVTT